MNTVKRPRKNTILAFFSILIIICPFAHAEFKEQGELSFQTRAFRDDNKDTTEDNVSYISVYCIDKISYKNYATINTEQGEERQELDEK